MNFKSVFAAATLSTCATFATAQDLTELSVGVGVTNFGLSLEAEYAVSPKIGVRGMLMGGFSVDDEFEVDDATVDGEADLGGFAIVGDYYPLSNPWRISGGLFFSNTDVTGEVTDGPLTYDGEIAFKNDVAPLITTGFSTEIAQGWSISGDVGVIISSLEVSSDNSDSDVQDDIAELNDDLEDLPVFPFIGFAVSYSY